VTEPESCLAWDLQVVQSQTDFIVLSLGPLSTMPHRLEITARSREFLSGIIVVMEDHDGGQWRSEILDLPPGDWSELQIEISELVRLSGDREVPDAARLRAIIIQDMTGQVSALQGSNRIEIRDTLIY
jgi:hypothetical protein